MKISKTTVIYDVKMIMKRAWTCVKKHGMSLSSALKWSWGIAKEEARLAITDMFEIEKDGQKATVKFYGDNTVTMNGRKMKSVVEFIETVNSNNFKIVKVA